MGFHPQGTPLPIPHISTGQHFGELQKEENYRIGVNIRQLHEPSTITGAGGPGLRERHFRGRFLGSKDFEFATAGGRRASMGRPAC